MPLSKLFERRNRKNINLKYIFKLMTKELEQKLKRCEQNLKKAYDELYRIKKLNKKKKYTTNLSKDDLAKINKSIKRIHKIEDKIKKCR